MEFEGRLQRDAFAVQAGNAAFIRGWNKGAACVQG